MSYTKIEQCHISDLVKHLRQVGYNQEEYPSKKTCIEELRKRGIYQIEIQSTRVQKKTQRSHLLASKKISSHEFQNSKNEFQNSKNDDRTMQSNPMFDRQFEVNSRSTTVFESTPDKRVNDNMAYDAAYQYLAVTNELIVNNKLYVDGNDVNQIVSNVNSSVDELNTMVANVNSMVADLNDKTNEIINMNLPMYNVAKTITIDNFQDLLLSANVNDDIFIDIVQWDFSGKLLDTTAHLSISFLANVVPSDSLRVRECTIVLPEYIRPDPDPFNIHDENTIPPFAYYPISKNFVNRQSNGEPTLAISSLLSKVAYVDSLSNKIVCKFETNANSNQIYFSLQTSYFIKPPPVESLIDLADVLGPLRYSTMYSKKIHSERETKSYVWTVFDEQVDLFINYNINVSADERLSNFTLDLPFSSSTTHRVDKVGSAIGFINTNDQGESLVNRDPIVVIKSNDPAKVAVDLNMSTAIFKLNMTIHISYYRDIIDSIIGFVFLNSDVSLAGASDDVFYEYNPEAKIKAKFVTIEPINRYYLSNNVKLKLPDGAPILSPDVVIRGIQTVWELEFTLSDFPESSSIGDIKGQIDLFDTSYYTTNQLHIVNADIEMDVAFVKTSYTIDIIITNIAHSIVSYLPHEIFVEVTNTRYPSFSTVVQTRQLDQNVVQENFTFDNLMHFTPYQIKIYTHDLLLRTTQIHDSIEYTERMPNDAPQIMNFEAYEVVDGVQLKADIYSFSPRDGVAYQPFPRNDNPVYIYFEIVNATTPNPNIENMQNPFVYQDDTSNISILVDTDNVTTTDLKVLMVASTNNVETTLVQEYVTIQYVYDSVIQGNPLIFMDDVYYSSNLMTVEYVLSKSDTTDIIAYLGGYVGNVDGDVVRFTDDPGVEGNLHLTIPLLSETSYVDSKQLIIDKYPLSNYNCDVNIESTNYQMYDITITFTNESYMKYSVNVEFDNISSSEPPDIVHLDPSLSTSWYSQTYSIRYPDLDANVFVTGNVAIMDRLDREFRHPFTLQTHGFPEILSSGYQVNELVRINSNIVERYAFDNWDGHVNWYVNEVIQDDSSNLDATFDITISNYDSPYFFANIKANTTESFMEIYGNISIPIAGIQYGNIGIEFDEKYYNIQSDIEVTFTLLGEDVNDTNINIQLFQPNEDGQDLVVSQEAIFITNSANVSQTFQSVEDERRVGECYARVEIIQNSQKLVFSNKSSINSLIDQFPVSMLETTVVTDTFDVSRLLLMSIQDDSKIPHHIDIYIGGVISLGEYVWLGNISNVSTESSYPIVLCVLPDSYEKERDVIKLVVSDPLHANVTFYHPSTFRFGLKDEPIISHDYDRIHDLSYGNIQCSVIAQTEENLVKPPFNVGYRLQNEYGNIVGLNVIENIDSLDAVHFLTSNVQTNLIHHVYLSISDDFETTSHELYVGVLYIPFYTFIPLQTIGMVFRQLNPVETGHMICLPSISLVDNRFSRHTIYSMVCSIESDTIFSVTKNTTTDYVRTTDVNDTFVFCSENSVVFDPSTDVKSIYPFHIVAQVVANETVDLRWKVHELVLKDNDTSLTHVVSPTDTPQHIHFAIHMVDENSVATYESFAIWSGTSEYDTWIPHLSSSGL